MKAAARPPLWQILLAFGVIYFVWGSTFLAIRISVHEVPPFLCAAMRFFTAGVVMYAWLRLKGTPSPTRRQWVGASVLGGMIFVLDYGCLFWAEQRVPSGIAAVILATVPVFISLLEITLLRTARLTVRLAFALLLGIFGVAVLMNNSFAAGEVPIDRLAVAALLIASANWSLATVLTRRFPLPESKAMSSAAQMFSGGLQLIAFAAITGELTGFHPRGGFLERMVRVALPDHRRVDRRLHCLCVAAALRIADQGWHLRVCESGGRGRAGIFSRRRSRRPQNPDRDPAHPDQRSGHQLDPWTPHSRQPGKRYRRPTILGSLTALSPALILGNEFAGVDASRPSRRPLQSHRKRGAVSSAG